MRSQVEKRAAKDTTLDEAHILATGDSRCRKSAILTRAYFREIESEILRCFCIAPTTDAAVKLRRARCIWRKVIECSPYDRVPADDELRLRFLSFLSRSISPQVSRQGRLLNRETEDAAEAARLFVRDRAATSPKVLRSSAFALVGIRECETSSRNGASRWVCSERSVFSATDRNFRIGVREGWAFSRLRRGSFSIGATLRLRIAKRFSTTVFTRDALTRAEFW